MFHPSHRVTDLVEVESSFNRVSGARLNVLSGVLSGAEVQNPENRNDYSAFTTIRDVVFDSLDPTRFTRAGQQLYPDVTTSHLNGLG